MATLNDTGGWVAGVYQLETTDPATGGAGGKANQQAQELAQRTAYLKDQVELRAPLESPALTGNPTATTQTAGNSSTRLATTAFVAGAVADRAPLASPAFTGTPTAPTASPGTGTTQVATTAFVGAAVSAAVSAANGSTAIVAEAGASHTLATNEAGSMIRFTATGAKTLHVNGSSGHTTGATYNVTNRAASGDVTLTPAGSMTLNAPNGGTLVLEPGDTVTLHCVSSSVMDVLGSTKGAA